MLDAPLGCARCEALRARPGAPCAAGHSAEREQAPPSALSQRRVRSSSEARPLDGEGEHHLDGALCECSLRHRLACSPWRRGSVRFSRAVEERAWST